LVLGLMPIVPLFVITLMLLSGIAGIYGPAVQASTPVLLNDDKIMTGNSMITMVSTMSGLLGPAIGGMIYGKWGIVPILIMSIVCFIFSAIMEIFIKIPHVKQNNEKGSFAIVKADLKEAFVFVKTEKPIFFNIALISCVINMFYASALIIGMPVIIIKILDLSDSMLGFNEGFYALGGLVGGLMTAMLAKKLKIKKLYALLAFLAIPTAVIGITLLFSTSPIATYYILTAMGFLSAISTTSCSIQIITIVQRQTPPQLLGKVMAGIIALSLCAMPIGQAIYGLLFDIFSNNSGFILLAVTVIIFALGMYSKSVFKKLTEY